MGTPRPSDTSVAVIQPARPLHESGSLQVVTYDNKGQMIGNYPDLIQIRDDVPTKNRGL